MFLMLLLGGVLNEAKKFRVGEQHEGKLKELDILEAIVKYVKRTDELNEVLSNNDMEKEKHNKDHED